MANVIRVIAMIWATSLCAMVVLGMVALYWEVC
jgi:hypothetical protein